MNNPTSLFFEKFGEKAGQFGVSVVSDIAMATANAFFPNTFEYYMLAFELTKLDGTKEIVVDRFIFPVNPQSINVSETKINNIQKTQSGIVALSSNTLNPVEINISGTFGRSWKSMVGLVETNLPSTLGEITKEITFYSPTITTGYGCLKKLENLFKKINDASTGKPYKCYFYNLSFNEIYIVKMGSFRHRMTDSQNMLWFYDMAMTGISRSTRTLGGSKTNQAVITGTTAILNQINRRAGDITKLLV